MSVMDPVCGMQVDPEKAKARTSYGGQDYFFCCDGCREKFEREPEKYLEISVEATDAVCGMSVDPSSAAHRYEHRGVEYLFCCSGCREKFAATPQKYLGTGSVDDEPAGDLSAGTYTCPMHPEIASQGPAACPECEPLSYGLELRAGPLFALKPGGQAFFIQLAGDIELSLLRFAGMARLRRSWHSHHSANIS